MASTGNFYNNPTPANRTILPPVSAETHIYNEQIRRAKETIKKEVGLFGGYKFNPDEIRFTTQNPRERVFVLLRAHPSTNIGWIMRLVIWAVLPLIILGLAGFVGLDLRQIPVLVQLIGEDRISRIFILFVLVYYSGLLTLSIVNYTNWYYNLYLITNERIIDYDFRMLVSYNIAEARLENIEDVKEKSIGFLPSLLGYGDIYVQTAAHNSNFSFNSVPKPSEVRDIIADLSNFSRHMYGRLPGIRNE